MLVSSGLVSFLLDYKSIVRAFTGLLSTFKKRSSAGAATNASGAPSEQDEVAAVEAPDWWFPAGFLALSPFVVALMAYLFQIPIGAALLAIPLAVIMGFVAARVTGDTDVTPTKALGPVTQLVFGVLSPGNLSGNIMSANVTGGIGLHAADLLTTMKTGRLLGASPRAQVKAQLFGVLAGAAIVVPAFSLLIPDPSELGGEKWPAPSCLVWAGVSKALSGGVEALHPLAREMAIIAAILGIALALAEKFAPPKLKAFVPSPSGIGIAMVIPGSNAIAMFLGSLTAEALRRKKKDIYDRYVVPVASGLIAGESLMGILVALLIVAGVFAK
jgi:uncharacterized oligopeptide transporter (OPT) family protein